MKTVFRRIYELPADLPEVEEFEASVNQANDATWAYVESLGGLGFYTASYYGHMTGIVFDSNKVVGDFAKLWKAESTYHPGAAKACLCVPKQTKAAKEARDAFNAVPRIPQGHELIKALGWERGRVSDGSRTYWATAHVLSHPRRRIFADVPRQVGDGWMPCVDFRPVPTEEYMNAIAAHNAQFPADAPD